MSLICIRKHIIKLSSKFFDPPLFADNTIISYNKVIKQNVAKNIYAKQVSSMMLRIFIQYK